MDVHARESGSPMRSNSVAPTYESRTGDSLRPAEAEGSTFFGLAFARADDQHGWHARAVAGGGLADGLDVEAGGATRRAMIGR